MSGAWLHVRARGGPRFVLGLVTVTGLAWIGAQWLATRPYFDGPGARVPVIALAPLLAALLLGPTLAGADEQLERGTPVRWRRRRAGQVAAGTVLIAVGLALTGLRSPGDFGAYALIRNTLGCVGLVAGAATAIGARLAWLPAFGYVSAVYAAGSARTGNVWAWPVAPSTSGASWVAAVAVAASGVSGYVLLGAREHRQVRDDE